MSESIYNIGAIGYDEFFGQVTRLEHFDAHDLPFADGSFDAVICQLGLMFFDDPVRALREFRRVLRSGGRAAVSVNSTPERSLFLRVGAVIARHVPAKAEIFTRPFSIRDAGRLHGLFDNAGFQEIRVSKETRGISFASFDDYFGAIEKGATISGQEYVLLSEQLSHRVREDVRRGLPVPNDDGAFTIEMDLLIGSGRA
jgi:SAM-dependent methyltransferase